MIAPIVDALADLGITEPFAIQQLCIPQAMDGRDLIGQAKTGTGKTLGFGIPVLQKIAGAADEAQGTGSSAGPAALVMVPTRELCVQVAADLEQAGARLGIRVAAIYGGRSYEPQVEAIKAGVDVVVGTPGRVIDLSRQRLLALGGVRVLVIDEADEMLDMGFLPDVERIVSMLPPQRQTMLFSATMPAQIIALGRRYMNQPTHIRAVNPDDDSSLVASVEQHVWRVHPMNKDELLARVMQAQDRGLSMVFCRTKRRAQQVADELTSRGFAAGAVHGDLGQGAREQALRAFRNGKIDVLVATDVAARGIDVDDVTHVINYECPDDEKTYLHRVGRTARAGKSGVAVTFVDWEDVPRWQLINKALGLAFHDPVETYHTSEHVYAGLGIPADAPGRLPRAMRTRAGLEAETMEDLGGPHKRSRQRVRSAGGRGSTANPRERKRPAEHAHGRRARHPQDSSAEPTAQGQPGQAGAAQVQPDEVDSPSAAARPKPARRRRRTRHGQPMTRSGSGPTPADPGGEPGAGEPADD